MKEVMLSIYVPTYNHEKYIEKAIDGIMMQKTKYTYEVLIGEDCSTDQTRRVLQECERKYPNKIKVYYREHNMHKQRPNNAGDLKRRCRGKYIICLEGDDYWLDENKIEKQIDFLEKHPEYIAVAHNCLVVDENSEPNGEEYPECKDTDYSLRHFVSEIMPGQLTTFMYRNIFRDEIIDMSIIENNRYAQGDRTTYFALILNGKIYCMQSKMSAYRHVKKGGSSYSANYNYNFSKAEQWNLLLLKYAEKICGKMSEEYTYAELLYFRNLVSGLKSGQCSRKQFRKLMSIFQSKGRILKIYLRHYFRHHILRKELWV